MSTSVKKSISYKLRYGHGICRQKKTRLRSED